jgi:hypothetical protein
MTQGALIFAYNNETVDYVSMAAWSAGNIHRHLDIPVCLVTDKIDVDLEKYFDKIVLVDPPETQQRRYFRDYKATGTWFNTNRVNAYNLSPWDHTLLLDADYVVATDQLKTVLATDQDFLCHSHADDITGNLPFQGNATFGTYQMPMLWATVISFRRGRTSELTFGAMEMIRDNWQHYLELYQIDEQTYRNDFALSIAANIVEGHTLSTPAIPWSLATVTPETKLSCLDQDTYRLDYQNLEQKPKWITIKQDFHAMCKSDLGAIIASQI